MEGHKGIVPVARVSIQARPVRAVSFSSRLALMDDRTVASNPGRLSVQYFRYASHFPFWPVCLATGLVVALTATAIRPGLSWVAGLTAGLNALCWLRVRLHFRL